MVQVFNFYGLYLVTPKKAIEEKFLHAKHGKPLILNSETCSSIRNVSELLEVLGATTGDEICRPRTFERSRLLAQDITDKRLKLH